MNEFSIERKVYYHHTDTGGVVYYGRYLELLEESRAEFCLSKGINLPEYAAQGISFPVVHVEVDYKAPARYGDLLRITSAPEKIGNASIHFFQTIQKNHLILLQAKTVWACIDHSFNARPIPEAIKNALNAR